MINKERQLKTEIYKTEKNTSLVEKWCGTVN